MAEQEEVFIDGAWYEAQIDEARTDESMNAGTPGIVFKWTVVEGEMAGKSIWDERWITVNSADRHRKDISSVLEYDIAKEDLEEINSALTGKRARIQVGIEEWPPNSKKFRAKVKRMRKAGDETTILPPAQRIAKLFGLEDERQGEWDKDKKF